MNYKMEECPICFEKLETDVGVLVCKHSFHCCCLLEWRRNLFDSPMFCPLCRGPGELIAIFDFYLSKSGRLRYKFSSARVRERAKKSWICNNASGVNASGGGCPSIV